MKTIIDYEKDLAEALRSLVESPMGGDSGLTSEERKLIREKRASDMLMAAEHLYTAITGRAVQRIRSPW